jgi:hypothetical protein
VASTSCRRFAEFGALGQHGGGMTATISSQLGLSCVSASAARRFCSAVRFSLGTSRASRSFGVEQGSAFFADLRVKGLGQFLKGILDGRQPCLIVLLGRLPRGLFVSGGDLHIFAFGAGEDGLSA